MIDASESRPIYQHISDMITDLSAAHKKGQNLSRLHHLETSPNNALFCAIFVHQCFMKIQDTDRKLGWVRML